jgi:RimJ/RimL family protein N-acetyltransferase
MKADSEPPQPTSQLSDYFAPLALRVVTPRLTLQLPSGPELYQLLHIIEGGIHDPSQMPFINAWTDVASPRRERESLARWWRLRAEWTTRDWCWSGAVHVADRIVGVQDLAAIDFGVSRQVRTASWLGLEFQGQGLGREMREAVLHFAFSELGATRAISGFVEGNVSSQKVSESLGYVVTGVEEVEIRGRPVHRTNLVLERSVWEPHRRHDITVEGLDECREWFVVA